MMICCEGKYASLYSQERVKLAHLGLLLGTSTGYYMTFHQLLNPACHIPHWENAGEWEEIEHCKDWVNSGGSLRNMPI